MFSCASSSRFGGSIGFEVVGYVVMPEHFHVLIGEPEIGRPSTVLQV